MLLGGQTICADNPEMNARMKLVASILNLRAHNVWNMAKTQMVKMYGPIDIEGHLGRDGRFYILDAARLFPPAIPIKGYESLHACTHQQIVYL